MAAAVDEFGGIDFLHANAADMTEAAILSDTDAVDVDLGVFDRTIAVNLRGFLLCTRHAVPLMLERGGGAIVYTSSATAHVGEPQRPSYGDLQERHQRARCGTSRRAGVARASGRTASPRAWCSARRCSNTPTKLPRLRARPRSRRPPRRARGHRRRGRVPHVGRRGLDHRAGDQRRRRFDRSSLTRARSRAARRCRGVSQQEVTDDRRTDPRRLRPRRAVRTPHRHLVLRAEASCPPHHRACASSSSASSFSFVTMKLSGSTISSHR